MLTMASQLLQTHWLARLASSLEQRLHQLHFTDPLYKDEKESCITIKSTALTMYFVLGDKELAFIINPDQHDHSEKGFFINLIYSPSKFFPYLLEANRLIAILFLSRLCRLLI